MSIPALTALLATLALGATPAEQQEARDLSKRSIVEYNGGEFEKALADIQRAYDLDPRPGLLFNLGQCHRGLEHWKKAKFFYEGYLRELPDAPNRKAVRALLEEVNRKVQELDEKEAAAQAAQRPPERIQTEVPIIIAPPSAEPMLAPGAFAEYKEPETHKSRTAGWALGGIGLGAGAVGGVLEILANDIFSKGSAQGGSGACPAGAAACYSFTYGQYATASNETTAAEVLWGVGGALIVTGVVLLLTAH